VIRAVQRDTLAMAVCSGVAMALATVATWQGAGLSVDSVGYLSTGVNIAGGDGWVMLADQPVTIFPPGLPLIAALGEVLGLGAASTLRLVSILSIGVVVVLGGMLLRRVATHDVVALLATGLLAVSPALLGISRMAWSEPPFIAVTLGFLLVLGHVVERRSLTSRDVVALAAFCSAAFLLRYVGVSLVVVAAVVLLFSLRPLDRPTLGRVAGFGVLSSIVPLAVMVRNHDADGTILGNRLPSHDSIGEVAGRTAATFGEWLLPVAGVERKPLAVLGGVGAIVLVVGLVAALWTGSRNRHVGAAGAPRAGVLRCCVVFIVVYVAYMTGASLSTSFEPTNSRYLSPVLVPTVVVGAVVASHLVGARRRGVGWVLGVAMAVLLVGHLTVSVDDARAGAADGIGFNSTAWTESEVAAATTELVTGGPPAIVYSNSPNALWAATRMQPIHWAPRVTGFRGAPLEGELETFVQDVRCSKHVTYLVIFLAGDGRVVPLEEISSVLELDRVRVIVGEGAVFRVSAPPGGEAGCTGAPDRRPTRVP